MKQQVKVNPSVTFQVAISYHHAANRLLVSVEDEDRAGRDISVPYMMLTAFTCELYMKTAYAVENNGVTIRDKHALNVLFGRLSWPFQDAVRKGWNSTTASIHQLLPDANLDLYANLKTSRDAFEDFRYFHEGKAGNFLLGRLPDVLQEVLIAFYPALKELRRLCLAPSLLFQKGAESGIHHCPSRKLSI